MFQEDKFARKFYCKHAKLGSVRTDKKQSTKAWRNSEKEIIKEYIGEIENGTMDEEN